MTSIQYIHSGDEHVWLQLDPKYSCVILRNWTEIRIVTWQSGILPLDQDSPVVLTAFENFYNEESTYQF